MDFFVLSVSQTDTNETIQAKPLRTHGANRLIYCALLLKKVGNHWNQRFAGYLTSLGFNLCVRVEVEVEVSQ